MKSNFLKKAAAAVIAAMLAVSVMTGCSSDDGSPAITKISNKSAEDSLPGGYKLSEYNEEQQGKLYLTEGGMIIINAYNYTKEDLPDMATWADSACANIRLTNIMMYGQDTDFHDPENVKVCGLDGIRYDTEIKQYTQFDEDGNKLEEGSFRLRGRNYFFFSGYNAYVIMFSCYEEDWDEKSAQFEEFVNDLKVTK